MAIARGGAGGRGSNARSRSAAGQHGGHVRRRRAAGARKSRLLARRPHRVALHPLVGLLARHAARAPARAAPCPRRPRRATARGSRASAPGRRPCPSTMRVKRRSMWSSAMKLSGRMTRSTDECEMSRSCQSATFSRAASALPRTSRASPHDLLAADRVALVRHRRRALLALAERLLDLADLGLLQAADLEGELLERGGA